MAGKKRRRRYTASQKGRRRRIIGGATVLLIGALLIVLIMRGTFSNFGTSDTLSDSLSQERQENPEYWEGCPEINAQLLTPNEYSRPQITLSEINAIVIHYTANPGSTALGNRNYFESLKDGSGTKASAHFIVGLEGEVVQCIPSSEMAYANHPRNSDTLSIECCHEDDSGQFNESTRQTLVELTAWLCKSFDVSPDNVIRHYDVSGKSCPLYYVEHEEEWASLKQDISEQYDKLLMGSQT